ncbi:GGDEF domain-containing protein [Pseudoalteromonas sp. T1lg48]|uniref:GGDEF domain-containing protein n=1 Tax=Pseudoalteromonas sp. T1lg48 TaxID=2077100 RepID=UPI000CF60EEE|nr:GGDEF domain-containing protein [Pseudoalteromonas sp. T1lg48]
MSEQLEALRKKLHSAISQRQTIEMTRQEQVSTLAQFIAKLSLVCKGIDLELDNRLASFRKHLQQGAHFQELGPIIAELTTLLARHEAKIEAQLRQLHTCVNQAGVNLQKRQGLPNESRRTLRDLLNTHLHEVQTPLDFIPVFARLVSIYDQVLSASNATDGKDNAEEVAHFANELTQLSTEVSVQGEFIEQMRALKHNINAATEFEQLLAASIELTRIIVTSLSRERRSAQHFLAALNESLSELQQLLANTVDKSRQLDSKISAVYQQIDENINQLSQHTELATNIAELKSTVESRLASLTAQLINKEQLEAEHRDALHQGLQSMQSRVQNLEQQVQQYEASLERQRLMNLQDGLTKLPNRLAFDERLDLELKQCQRNGAPLCLVVIDVDLFKSINDTYGHSAGDKTLQVLASAMKKAIRSSDFIARYGGEEFVLVMPNVDLENVVLPLEKLRASVKSIPFKFKDKQVQITVSIGATQVKANDTALSAFDRADQALYEAKHAGRDRLVVKQ